MDPQEIISTLEGCDRLFTVGGSLSAGVGGSTSGSSPSSTLITGDQYSLLTGNALNNSAGCGGGGHGGNSISISLLEGNLWDKFHSITNEMIVTKTGRRMFPVVKFAIGGLDPRGTYTMAVEFVQVGGSRWKYVNGEWVAGGKSEPVISKALYRHPDSPNFGVHWMKESVKFDRVKLTNKPNAPRDQVILNSLHKYEPRVHVIRHEPDGGTRLLVSFRFEDAQFIAVTAYQNEEVTQLKIRYNPFAKAFQDARDRPHEPYLSPLHGMGMGMGVGHMNMAAMGHHMSSMSGGYYTNPSMLSPAAANYSPPPLPMISSSAVSGSHAPPPSTATAPLSSSYNLSNSSPSSGHVPVITTAVSYSQGVAPATTSAAATSGYSHHSSPAWYDSDYSPYPAAASATSFSHHHLHQHHYGGPNSTSLMAVPGLVDITAAPTTPTNVIITHNHNESTPPGHDQNGQHRSEYTQRDAVKSSPSTTPPALISLEKDSKGTSPVTSATSATTPSASSSFSLYSPSSSGPLRTSFSTVQSHRYAPYGGGGGAPSASYRASRHSASNNSTPSTSSSSAASLVGLDHQTSIHQTTNGNGISPVTSLTTEFHHPYTFPSHHSLSHSTYPHPVYAYHDLQPPLAFSAYETIPTGGLYSSGTTNSGGGGSLLAHTGPNATATTTTGMAGSATGTGTGGMGSLLYSSIAITAMDVVGGQHQHHPHQTVHNLDVPPSSSSVASSSPPPSSIAQQ